MTNPMLPGGDAAVVPITAYDVAENKGRTRLHLVTVDGASRSLTREDADSTAPAVTNVTSTAADAKRRGDPSGTKANASGRKGGVLRLRLCGDRVTILGQAVTVFTGDMRA